MDRPLEDQCSLASSTSNIMGVCWLSRVAALPPYGLDYPLIYQSNCSTVFWRAYGVVLVLILAWALSGDLYPCGGAQL